MRLSMCAEARRAVTRAFCSFCLLLLSTAASNAAGAYNITISSGTTAGGSWVSTSFTSTFTSSANDAVLNVTDLTNHIATLPVIVRTGTAGSQAGTITVDSSVSTNLTWSARSLTLDAYTSISVQGTIAATGTASLILKTNDTGTGGTLFFNGGKATFASTSEALTINGTSYTLINNTYSALTTTLGGTTGGNYAVIGDIDASTQSPTSTPIVNSNAYTFEGLGNKMSNLTIDDTTAADSVALFSEVASTGAINNYRFTNTTISGEANGSSGKVGGLVVSNYGTLFNDSVSGSLSMTCASGSSCTAGPTAYWVGGLAAESQGTITSSSSSASVTNSVTGSSVGGLVGSNDNGTSGPSPTITNSSASGAISGASADYDGGLVGQNFGGTIVTSDATGAVTCSSSPGGYLGGLVGWSVQGNAHSGVHPAGTIEGSYATGNVGSSSCGVHVGGLVGAQSTNTVIEAATSCSGSSGVTVSYATGNVVSESAGHIGGLVGENGGSITCTFSKGSVTGNGGYTGGLVGENEQSSNVGTIAQSFAECVISNLVKDNGSGEVGGIAGDSSTSGSSITNSYSLCPVTSSSSSGGQGTGGFTGLAGDTTYNCTYETGTVTPTTNPMNGKVGGYIGDDQTTNTYNYDYWDTTTNPHLSATGNQGNPTGITGDITANLQALLTGFNGATCGSGIWAQSGSINGAFPYLEANPPQ